MYTEWLDISPLLTRFCTLLGIKFDRGLDFVEVKGQGHGTVYTMLCAVYLSWISYLELAYFVWNLLSSKVNSMVEQGLWLAIMYDRKKLCFLTGSPWNRYSLSDAKLSGKLTKVVIDDSIYKCMS